METNGLQDLDITPEQWQEHLDSIEGTVDWSDPRLKRVTRLRLVSDPGFPWWDVSYCHGVLENGANVRVSLPFNHLPKRGTARAIVRYAIKDDVYAKKLGLFANISTLQ